MDIVLIDRRKVESALKSLNEIVENLEKSNINKGSFEYVVIKYNIHMLIKVLKETIV